SLAHEEQVSGRAGGNRTRPGTQPSDATLQRGRRRLDLSICVIQPGTQVPGFLLRAPSHDAGYMLYSGINQPLVPGAVGMKKFPVLIGILVGLVFLSPL